MIVTAALTQARTQAADSPVVDVAFDVNVTGNGDNVLGPTDACNDTPLQVGDTMEVDLVIRDVPLAGGQDYGIAAFGFNLLFDPLVLRVDRVLEFNGPTILKADGPPGAFVVLDYDGDVYTGTNQDPPPSTNGNVRVDVGDISGMRESGDGVLTRMSITAIGEGSTALFASDLMDSPVPDGTPDIYYSSDGLYTLVSLPTASIVVGDYDCPAVRPTPIPSPTAQPTPVRRPAWLVAEILGGVVVQGSTITVPFAAGSADANVDRLLIHISFEPGKLGYVACTSDNVACGLKNGYPNLVEFVADNVVRGHPFKGSVTFQAKPPPGSSSVKVSLSGYSAGYDIYPGDASATINIVSNVTPTPTRIPYSGPGGRGGDSPVALPVVGGPPVAPSSGPPAPGVIAIGIVLAALGWWLASNRHTRHQR